jgi:AcrR family transcriptional regulator
MSSVSALSSLLYRDETNPQAANAVDSRILDAAIQLFAEFGLKRTSMEDVARRAGVGRATIYRRFAQKDDLVRATIVREGMRFLAGIRLATEGLRDREEALVSGFVLTVVNASTHPLVRRLLATEPETTLPYLTINAPQLVDVTRAFFRSVLEEEVAGGLTFNGDLDDIAELIVRLLHSMLLTTSSWLPLDDESRLGRFGRNILRQFLQATPN